MPEIGNKNPTLLDVVNRLSPNGSVEKDIVEAMNETNEINEDATFIECNDGSSHKSIIRTGIPEPVWRKLNYGVPNGKSTTQPVKDSCGMLETYAEVDKALADMSGDAAAFRKTEDLAFIEGMNQTFARTAFYGNTDVHPERFMGLAPRFSSLSAGNGGNIINANGDDGNNTSIWLIVWSPRTAHFLYPKGSRAGLQITDKGPQTLKDVNGGQYEGYRTHYKWDVGMTVRDWNYVVRIANIKHSALTKDAQAGADLIDLMTQALEIPPSLGAGRPVFYCNKKIRQFLRRQIRNSKNVNLTLEQVAGKKVVAFDEVPVRRCDQILLNEALVA